MNDERYDVESGNVPGKRKMSRFVNEYAQCQIFCHIQKARATAEPSLKAKNFLRVSVTPAFRPSSRGIIPNLVLGSQRAKQSRLKSCTLCESNRNGKVSRWRTEAKRKKDRERKRKEKRSKSNGNEKFIPHGVIPFGIICGKGDEIIYEFNGEYLFENPFFREWVRRR